MKVSEELKKAILKAPKSQVDSKIKTMVSDWGETVTAEQILMVLDEAVNKKLCSGFSVIMFEVILGVAMREENITLEQLRAQYGSGIDKEEK